MVFYVYIIQSIKDGGLYLGHTQDLQNRLKQHNDKNRKTYTSKRGPWKMLYYEEQQTRSLAMQRERFLKSHAGSHEKKLLAGICDEKQKQYE
jgi:putative endonuclease